jgi:hypothetical protein
LLLDLLGTRLPIKTDGFACVLRQFRENVLLGHYGRVWDAKMATSNSAAFFHPLFIGVDLCLVQIIASVVVFFMRTRGLTHKFNCR